MKKQIKGRPATTPLPIPAISLKAKDRKAFLSSVKQLNEQCGRLGLLDPVEFEPAILYSALEEEK